MCYIAVAMAFVFSLEVEFRYRGREFIHIFSPESSYHLHYTESTIPFDPITCVRCYNSELFPHFRQNRDVNDYFAYLDFNPESWLTDLAEFLPHLNRFVKIPQCSVPPIRVPSRHVDVHDDYEAQWGDEWDEDWEDEWD